VIGNRDFRKIIIFLNQSLPSLFKGKIIQNRQYIVLIIENSVLSIEYNTIFKILKVEK